MTGFIRFLQLGPPKKCGFENEFIRICLIADNPDIGAGWFNGHLQTRNMRLQISALIDWKNGQMTRRATYSLLFVIVTIYASIGLF